VGGFPDLPGATTNPRSSMLLGYGMSRPAAECLRVAAGFDLDGTQPENLDGLVGRGTGVRSRTQLAVRLDPDNPHSGATRPDRGPRH
jgi:hypothetical protein